MHMVITCELTRWLGVGGLISPYIQVEWHNFLFILLSGVPYNYDLFIFNLIVMFVDLCWLEIYIINLFSRSVDKLWFYPFVVEFYMVIIVLVKIELRLNNSEDEILINKYNGIGVGCDKGLKDDVVFSCIKC